MAVTQADYGAMKLSIAQLHESVAQAEALMKQAETTLDHARAAWSSPHAAKKLHAVMQEWSEDQQRMTEMVAQLHALLDKVYQDLS